MSISLPSTHRTWKSGGNAHKKLVARIEAELLAHPRDGDMSIAVRLGCYRVDVVRVRDRLRKRGAL